MTVGATEAIEDSDIMLYDSKRNGKGQTTAYPTSKERLAVSQKAPRPTKRPEVVATPPKTQKPSEQEPVDGAEEGELDFALTEEDRKLIEGMTAEQKVAYMNKLRKLKRLEDQEKNRRAQLHEKRKTSE